MHLMTLVFPIANAEVYYEKENVHNYFFFLNRMAIISLEKEFKFSILLLRRTQEKVTLDNFA